MSCSFITPVTEDINELYRKALLEMGNHDITFEGNAEGGEFSVRTVIGEIHGSFKVHGQVIQWHFTKKPIFISCKRIEHAFKKHLY
ncbi:MAG TPA: hypothetical protein DIW47_01070 [Bacteroidetes bacterium]|nr:hypothetical protein [Bacteroidota bacterium]